ncbi:MAG: PKD domain-containing protein, partial [Fulvivirga sp.]|nr:PKD domain-containing protein [Fulvivirga sp.]
AVSTERDLIYNFDNGGTFNIKLITSIPGCSHEVVKSVDIIAGPEPDFTVNDDCVGALFQFNNTTTGADIISYEWDFGNGFMSNQENPDPFEYSAPGTYTVTLITENASGCITSIQKSVTVYDLPNVNFSNELACEQAPTQFTDLSSVNNANIMAWEWDFNDPESVSNSSSEQNPTHVFSSAGTYNVKLIVTSTFGCIDSLVQTVTVKDAPIADFTWDKICIGEEVQFQDESEAVPGEVLTSWAWDLGGVFSDQQNPTATFDFPIDYNVSLSVTSQNKCTNTIEKVISVNPAPEVEFAIAQACDNQPVHLYDTTEPVVDPIVSREWDFDGLGSASDSSVFFQFPSSGDYNVSLSLLTAEGCDYSGQQAVTINEAPEAAFEVSADFGAPPFEVAFTNNSGDVSMYHWDFDDGDISDAKNPVHVFEQEGTFEVMLAIENNNGCRDTATQVINALFPRLDITLEQLTVIDNQLILTMINNGTIRLDSMKALIDFGNEVVIEEKIKSTLLPAENPSAVNHSLALNLFSKNVDYVCVTLEAYLEDQPDVNRYDNTKCHNFELPVVFIKPFPNPARDQLNIAIISQFAREGALRIIDSKGKVVREMSIEGIRGRNVITIDATEFRHGIYYIEAVYGGASSTSRVMIAK